ncbi:MAG TPA: hypothetical protein ENK95_02390 [Campylobacterales bacterium]|nr:hypothetical protein [Campylobacterales bacterium]
MKKIFKLILLILTVTLLTGCCLEDHTKTIEKVAQPMLKELQQFYKEYKRFPTTKERDIMLTRSGCQMRGDVCFFEGKKLHIVHSSKDISGNYYMSIRMFDGKAISKNSLASCGFSIYRSGKLDYVGCSKRPCINLRQ